jgi:putative transposase
MGKSAYDPEIHHRRSIRLPDFDYSSPGPYVVTICTTGRQPVFEDEALRAILEEVWHGLPKEHPGLQLDAFVIMPDHLHFIVWLAQDGKQDVTLPEVVRTFKSLSAEKWFEHLNKLGVQGSGSFWQRNYYEHVVRDEADLAEQRTYVRNNPLKAAFLQNERALARRATHGRRMPSKPIRKSKGERTG